MKTLAAALLLILIATPLVEAVACPVMGPTGVAAGAVESGTDSAAPEETSIGRMGADTLSGDDDFNDREFAPSAPAESLAILREGVSGADDLWVLRGALVDSAAVDSTVARAQRMGVRGLLVQVVGRGDAWYDSDLLPRAEPLLRSPGFDPLARVVRRAHAAGLEVHTWVNCMLVWSSRRLPLDSRHVVRAHPEWVTCLKDGRPLYRVGPRERQRLGIEGVYLSPAHPGVRRWIASIAGEIVRRYDVDGIHLDYIRMPDAGGGYDPTTRARFALASGIDALRIDRLPAPRRAAAIAEWRAFLGGQMTGVVQAVRDTLNGVRDGLTLTAAVAADTNRAERDVAQPWRQWLASGLMDRVYPMCYSPGVQDVMDQLVGYLAHGLKDRVVPGIAVYNSSPSAAALKLLGARTLGFPRLALYSYDSLFEIRGRWQDLERQLAPAAPTLGGGP